MTRKLILVTGATGYIGGKLIPHLLERGYRVRCLVRNPARLQGRAWFPQVEFVRGDVVTGDSLQEAMQDVTSAYYLIHSMASGKRYHERDLSAARQFALAASQEGVERIIYLGGLADPQADIGFHMRSRIQTGEELRRTGVPVIEFRAGVIVGPGSISFEMIRYLTEQLPILVGPRWLNNRVQPVATQDVLEYLLAALETSDSHNAVFEIGGQEVVTFAEAMLTYARLRGLKRLLLTLPGIPVRLMAFGVDRLTPVPSSIAAPLIEGMRSDSIVWNPTVQQVFPQIKPLGYEEAVSAALSPRSPSEVGPAWKDEWNQVKIIKHEGFLIDYRQTILEAMPAAVYRAFTQLGGKHGWLYLNGLWRVRGLLDQLVGGPGMRGRLNEEELGVGEVVDFYRVEDLKPGRSLCLRAELRTPGVGWIEWVVIQRERQVLFSQAVFFLPSGIPGFLYWYLLYPVHRLVFAGLFRRISVRAREIQESVRAGDADGRGGSSDGY